jgi:hypothetical protein
MVRVSVCFNKIVYERLERVAERRGMVVDQLINDLCIKGLRTSALDGSSLNQILNGCRQAQLELEGMFDWFPSRLNQALNTLHETLPETARFLVLLLKSSRKHVTTNF